MKAVVILFIFMWFYRVFVAKIRKVSGVYDFFACFLMLVFCLDEKFYFHLIIIIYLATTSTSVTIKSYH